MNLYEIVLIYEGCKTVFDVSNKLYCGYLLLNLKWSEKVVLYLKWYCKLDFVILRRGLG